MPERSEMPHDESGQTSGDALRQVAPTRPPDRDVLNHANFGLLPKEQGRLSTFGISAGINITVAVVLILLTLAGVHQAQVHRQETLTYLTPQPKPYKPPPVPMVKMPPIPVLPKEQPRIQPPKPVIEPPKVHVEVATKAPVMPAPAVRRVITPPKPVLGTFAAAQQPAHQATRVAAAQTAGFGAPTGAHANPNSRASNVPVMGGFGAAANSNRGADSRLGQVASTGFGSGAPAGSPRGSEHGTVASTGFGSGTRREGQPGGRGTVASTGFGAGEPARRPAVPVQAAVATTPIIVLSKPLPQYTAEARAAHIQGDVTLEVRFTADGQVQVLRVVRGLGHGLDEQAVLAAQRIHFKPATRNGKPVDQVSVIRVTFELA